MICYVFHQIRTICSVCALCAACLPAGAAAASGPLAVSYMSERMLFRIPRSMNINSLHIRHMKKQILSLIAALAAFPLVAQEAATPAEAPCGNCSQDAAAQCPQAAAAAAMGFQQGFRLGFETGFNQAVRLMKGSACGAACPGGQGGAPKRPHAGHGQRPQQAAPRPMPRPQQVVPQQPVMQPVPAPQPAPQLMPQQEAVALPLVETA